MKPVRLAMLETIYGPGGVRENGEKGHTPLVDGWHWPTVSYTRSNTKQQANWNEMDLINGGGSRT